MLCICILAWRFFDKIIQDLDTFGKIISETSLSEEMGKKRYETKSIVWATWNGKKQFEIFKEKWHFTFCCKKESCRGFGKPAKGQLNHTCAQSLCFDWQGAGSRWKIPYFKNDVPLLCWQRFDCRDAEVNVVKVSDMKLYWFVGMCKTWIDWVGTPLINPVTNRPHKSGSIDWVL